MLAGIGNQSQVECEVMYGGYLHGQQFLGLEEMMQVGLGVDTVYLATIGIDRREVVFPLLVTHVHGALVSKEHGITAIMIQHYEQRRKKLGKAAFDTVFRLAQALHVPPQSIVEL